MGAPAYLNAVVRGLRPPDKLSIHELADRIRVLSQEEAAEPGRWKTSRTPYLRDIMEALSPHHPAQIVVFQKGAQIGGTEVILNALQYRMVHDPGPTMVVMPTEETARDWSKDRLGSMIRTTPQIARLFSGSSKDPNNAILYKKFPGGYIKIAYATSAAQLRSRPAGWILIDEPDGYVLDVDGEGCPVDLIIRRASTFGDRKKIALVSTPTLESTSRIASWYERSNKQLFWVPCTRCGVFQTLKPQQLEWPKGKPQLARYMCEHCEELLEENDKTEMLAHGYWKAEKPEVEEHGIWGFKLSSLYSPAGWLSWADCATAYHTAKKERSKEKMRVVVNTIWGETYRDAGETPDHEKLFLRRGGCKRGVVPKDGLVLTAGVDVQRDRLEMEVVAWGQNLRSWSVDYIVLHGDPAQGDVWKELEECIYRVYEHELGGTITVSRVAIDSGFETSHVYEFCRYQDPNRVIPIKGSARLNRALGAPSPVDTDSRGKPIRGGLHLWNVGVNIIKGEVYSFLLQPLPEEGSEERPRGWCEWPEYGMDYFRGLTAEERVITPKGITWQVIRPRNEPLDCRVYARAASIAIGIDRWDESRWEEEKNRILDSASPGHGSTSSPVKGGEQGPEAAPRHRRRQNDGWLNIGDSWL